MHGQDELDRNNMLALLQRWDSQSISNVQGTVYPLTERVELRAERILMLMGKLLSTVICVNGQKTNSDLLNLMLADVPGVSLQESILRWLEDREGFCRELEEFTAWFRREYPRAFENYFVYALFREFLPGDLDAERVGETFLVRVVLWSLIQLCAMSVWREGTLSRERYSMIICGLERISLHSSEIFDACIKILAEEKQTALLLLYLIY